MIVTREWLAEFVDHRLGPDELAALLTRLGYGVERFEKLGDDAVYELEVPSNRPELQSVIGLARDVATALGRDLKAADARPAEEGKPIGDWLQVKLECPDLCPRYTARVIEGVRVGPSPDALARRLERVGIRPVNNVVDITNYVMWEMGQPLHAFDLDLLGGRALVIRRPKPGETMVAIDGRTYSPAGDTCVIADAQRAVAIGGVMGGRTTEISAATRAVAIESARFDPATIRRTSKALALATPSSRRFERGVSWEGIEAASRRAAELMVKYAGGKLANGLADLGTGRPATRRLEVRRARVRRVLGLEVASDRIAAILRRVGFADLREEGDRFAGTAPEWRGDLAREEDLIEEIARFVGYDAIPQDVALTAEVTTTSPLDRFRRSVREALKALGCQEVLTWSFADEELDPLFAGAPIDEAISLRDPRGGVARRLRRFLAPGLLRVMATNERYKQPLQPIFEAAKAYEKSEPYGEPEMLCVAMPGEFPELRRILDALFLELGARVLWAPNTGPSAGARGRSAILQGEPAVQGGRPLGWASEVSAATLRAAGLREPVSVAEIALGELCRLGEGRSPAGDVPRFEAVRRDVAIEVDESVAWAQIERAVAEARVEHLERVEFFDLYRGGQIAAGKKSLAFSLVFRRADRTLAGPEVEAAVEKVVKALTERLGARRR